MTPSTLTPAGSSPRRVAGLLAAALLSLLPVPALAVMQQPFSMEVLVDGRPVAEYAARGTTYVEALQGRDYAVRLTNHTGGRVAIALSIDGLNSIDAQSTTASDARKWILDPWQSITIQGWQTGQSTARRFFFTSERESYGAWIGDTRNLGVISAAVFRERRPRPVPWSQRRDAEGKLEPRAQSGAPRPDRAPAPSSPSESREGAGAAAPRMKDSQADELAATGIGTEVNHPVTRVAFDHEPAPATVLSVRYEYRDALVRLGVLPRPLPECDERLSQRERARGFEDAGYAPDPYRPRCH